MHGNYSSLIHFIKTTLIAGDLPINHLKTTRSAINSIVSRFEEYGWRVERIEDPVSRHSRHTVTSPDGQETLSMVGGKVFRHPAHTEQICRRKHLTKRMLELDGIQTPAGADFTAKEKGVAAAVFTKLPKPVVVKPTDSGSSAGVTVGVNEVAEFNAAWVHALEGSRKDSNVLVEEFVQGVELRAFIIGNEVAHIVARVQPFVTGTGNQTVESLLGELIEDRSVHYRAMKMPVVTDWEFVAKQGHAPESLPAPGETVFLNPFCYPTIGASIIDVTGQVSSQIKEVAVRAKNAIPDLEVGGVDILASDLSDVGSAYVVEVNTAASLDMHRYPTHGSARDIDKDIVDYFHAQFLRSSGDAGLL